MDRAEYEAMYAMEDTHWWYVGRRNLATSLIEQWITLTSTAQILDVGCGTGGNLTVLKQYGSTIGLDLSPIAISLAQRRALYGLIQASGVDLPWADNTFDLITVFDVLYHNWIVDDEVVLRELYRITRPGGWLLITDSALPLLWSSHDQLYQARQRYTIDHMRRKLDKAGFEQRVCSYTNMLILPFVLLVRLTMDRLPFIERIDRWAVLPNRLNRSLTWLRNLEIRWLQRGRTLPIGSSIVALCQKP